MRGRGQPKVLDFCKLLSAVLGWFWPGQTGLGGCRRPSRCLRFTVLQFRDSAQATLVTSVTSFRAALLTPKCHGNVIHCDAATGEAPAAGPSICDRLGHFTVGAWD